MTQPPPPSASPAAASADAARAPLSPARLERFARQIVLPEVGGAGQVALARAHVVLIGAGGIGCPALQYLAGAGIGRLTVIDSDRVEAANLPRQTLFTPADLGRPKAEAAAAWVARFDGALEPRGVVGRVGGGNAAGLLEGATLVLDGSDNFATRLAVSDGCVALGVPLTSAALGRFQGQVANFAGHLPGQACYRCFVGDAFDADDCDSCAEQGVLGAMAGVVGSFAALHAIRVLLAGVASLGDPQWGRLHLLDGLAPGWRTVRIARDEACRGCAR